MERDQKQQKYRECLRNHAASLGSYATDGCGEFKLDDTCPASVQCSACGRHRNFHRKVTITSHEGGRNIETTMPTELMDYAADNSSGGKKKRFRTKFTSKQKEKMLEFAGKLGWKLQRKDVENEVERFCKGVGVSRQAFKVWMHNHKNSSSSSSASASASNGNASSLTTQE